MQCIAATRSVPLESWYVSVICAVYYISGANGYHYCITIIALWSDVVCSFFCITDDACADHMLIHNVYHHIMYCVLFITTCLKHCHMSFEQHYVHPAREPLPALLQYSRLQSDPFILQYGFTLLSNNKFTSIFDH